VNAQALFAEAELRRVSTLREAISAASRFPWLPPIAKLIAGRAVARTDTCQPA
jgi:hypothetical protein